jgi:hypothetical protein
MRFQASGLGFKPQTPNPKPQTGEVYITYGAKSNADLLVCYGFVLREQVQRNMYAKTKFPA